MCRSLFLAGVIPLVLLGYTQRSRADEGPLVSALWLVHSHGKAEQVDPRNDRRLKGVLTKSLNKDGVLSETAYRELMGGFIHKGSSVATDGLDLLEAKRMLEDDIHSKTCD